MEALRNGDSLVIFPEGTRGHTGEPAPFKSGLYALAQAFPEVQLIPAWIDNVQRVMPKGEVVPVPILCTVIFGAPIALQPGRGAARLPRPRPRGGGGAARGRLMGSLRSLTTSQQVGLLFVTLFGVLLLVTLVAFAPLVPRIERRPRAPCRSDSRASCARSGSARCCSGSPGSRARSSRPCCSAWSRSSPCASS